MSRALRLGLAALVVAGCGADFDPASYLNGLRILTVVHEPLDVGPSDTLRLTSVVFSLDDDPVATSAWTFCPFTAGGLGAFACVDERCESALTAQPDGSVAFLPAPLVLQCAEVLAERFGGSVLPRGDAAEDTPDSVEGVVRYTVTTASGAERTAIVRVPLWFEGPAEVNRPPVIRAVEARKAESDPWLPANELPTVGRDERLTFRVTVDPESLDTFVDEAERQRTEEPIVSFFASAGRFDRDRKAGSESENVWQAKKLEAGQDRARFWVVVRDGRGGQAVAGPFETAIEASPAE